MSVPERLGILVQSAFWKIAGPLYIPHGAYLPTVVVENWLVLDTSPTLLFVFKFLIKNFALGLLHSGAILFEISASGNVQILMLSWHNTRADAIPVVRPWTKVHNLLQQCRLRNRYRP